MELLVSHGMTLPCSRATFQALSAPSQNAKWIRFRIPFGLFRRMNFGVVCNGPVEMTLPRCEGALSLAFARWKRSFVFTPKMSRDMRCSVICAQVGRKEDAIREGRRAVELTPESRSALDAAGVAAVMALIYAQVGEVDQAIPLIERLLAVPGPVIEAPVSITLSDLRLRWEWDPLRKVHGSRN